MANKTRAKKYPATTPAAAKEALAGYYQALQLEWALALQSESTDWPHLFSLHFELAGLERRARWLTKERAA